MALRQKRYLKLLATIVLSLFWPVSGNADAQEGAKKHRPVRTDLREAIAQGVLALNNSFDRDRDDEPFFYANHLEDGTAEFRHSVHIGIPHVVGRCLWPAMLAEEVANVPFPEEGLKILTRFCRSSFDNPDHLNSYFDPEKGNQRFIEFHNMREGLFGLLALAKGRNLPWAKEKAHSMLLTLEKLTSPEGHLSIERAKKLGMASYCKGLGLDATTSGRLVDPLIEYYQFSNDPLALKLAGLYAKATLKTAFTEEGKFAPRKASGGHIHSITSSLSGITLYAAFRRDSTMLEACRRIVDQGVPEYFSSWGWGDEVMADHPANVQSRGEVNQIGDVIRTALTLGRHVGPEYYELAERYLRSMLLPSQLREENLKDFIREKAQPKGDAERNVLQRSIGGYGFPLPNDRMREGDWPIFTLDITSGAVHALCEAWRHRMTRDADVLKLNLLFDFDGPEFRIRSRLPHEGRIEFEAKDSKPLWIRIPEWVDRTTIQLALDDKAIPVRIEEGYLRLPALRSGSKGTVDFHLPERQKTEMVDGIEYRTKWIGNQILEIAPRGTVSPLPF
ncbi:MAG: hypothetical protein AB1898_27575 [Acidobacteriota bacterium]